MAEFKNETKLLTIFRAATSHPPMTFVKVCQALGMDPLSAAATFDPARIDDEDARTHVIRLHEYLGKPGWKRLLRIR